MQVTNSSTAIEDSAVRKGEPTFLAFDFKGIGLALLRHSTVDVGGVACTYACTVLMNIAQAQTQKEEVQRELARLNAKLENRLRTTSDEVRHG
jgi:hypothetical protein